MWQPLSTVDRHDGCTVRRVVLIETSRLPKTWGGGRGKGGHQPAYILASTIDPAPVPYV